MSGENVVTSVVGLAFAVMSRIENGTERSWGGQWEEELAVGEPEE